MKRDICTFDYSVRVMNNHAGLTLTRPTGTTFSHMTLGQGSSGEGLSRARDHITGPLHSHFICMSLHYLSGSKQ